MYRVTADSLSAYLNFDPTRKADLVRLHELVRSIAPDLKRYFHEGTPAGQAGMRMKMIGYGKFRYAAKSADVEWPVIGVALQKNYISVYVALTRDGKPILGPYAKRLGAARVGRNNFSFEKIDDIDTRALSSLISEIARVYRDDPENPVRYMQGD